MALMYYLQIFVVLLFVLIVKEIDGYKCSCDEGEVNCSSRSFAQYPSPEIPSECTIFKKIDLSNNELQIFPSMDLSYFEIINISRNKLKVLQSQVPLEVKILDVSENKIQRIEIQGSLRNLEQLYASNQDVLPNNTEIFIVKCSNLRILDVSKNHLKSLASVTNCQSISRLISSHNNITDLPKEFETLTELRYLDLSWNDIETLSHLPVNLEILNASHNKLNRIQSSSFESRNALTELDLSNNLIKEIDPNYFGSAVVLNRLDLSHNLLNLVPPLQLSNKVQNILLNVNNITSVNVDGVKKLMGSSEVPREIDMRENPIHKLDIGLQTLVKYLDFMGATVYIDDTCTCINATKGNTTLLLCVVDQDHERQCWVDIARQTTTTTTTVRTTSPTTHFTAESEKVAVENGIQTNAAEAMKSNNTNGTDSMNATKIDITYASHFMSSLGAAKISFLAFLLVTLLILIIINCIVGDPVVDDRWWEEKIRGDRVVT